MTLTFELDPDMVPFDPIFIYNLLSQSLYINMICCDNNAKTFENPDPLS